MLVPDKDITSAEEFYECLQLVLEQVPIRLSRAYPIEAVLHGVEHAWSTAIDAIFDGRAQTMTLPAWRSWLWVVARNATLTVLRKKKIVSLTDDQIPSQSETWSDFQRGLVLEALHELPADALALIEAVYFDGLTGRAAADLLDIRQTTFRRRHAAAILILRNIFEQLDNDKDFGKKGVAHSQAQCVV